MKYPTALLVAAFIFADQYRKKKMSRNTKAHLLTVALLKCVGIICIVIWFWPMILGWIAAALFCFLLCAVYVTLYWAIKGSLSDK